MKTKGLPYQTVQFQFMAKALRSFSEDSTLTKQSKLDMIESMQAQMIHAVNANAAFWASQCEDGEFAKYYKNQG